MLGCHRHLRLHRVRNEADFVSFMMQVIQLRLSGSLADPFDLGMKDNRRDGLLARRNFFHRSLRMVAIGSDGEARQSGHTSRVFSDSGPSGTFLDRGQRRFDFRAGSRSTAMNDLARVR